MEESDSKSVSRTLKFKAINHIWGYVLKVPPKEAENTSLDVVGATDVSNEAQDVSPLGAQRAWVQQAEDNVVERLFQAGLLDAPSEFDKTLEALAGNILAYNNITLSRPIRCRTLLTEPLESIAIGNTIILSKSLLDTTAIVSQDGAQQMGNLNAILAFQIAHIILAHRLDTKYRLQRSSALPHAPRSSTAFRCTTPTRTTPQRPRRRSSCSASRSLRVVSNTSASTCSSCSRAREVAEGPQRADDRRWPGQER